MLQKHNTTDSSVPLWLFAPFSFSPSLSLSPTIYIIIIIIFTVEMWLWVHFQQREASGVSGRGWVTSWSGWGRWWLGHKMMIIMKAVMVILVMMSQQTRFAEKSWDFVPIGRIEFWGVGTVGPIPSFRRNIPTWGIPTTIGTTWWLHTWVPLGHYLSRP